MMKENFKGYHINYYDYCIIYDKDFNRITSIGEDYESYFTLKEQAHDYINFITRKLPKNKERF